MPDGTSVIVELPDPKSATVAVIFTLPESVNASTLKGTTPFEAETVLCGAPAGDAVVKTNALVGSELEMVTEAVGDTSTGRRPEVDAIKSFPMVKSLNVNGRWITLTFRGLAEGGAAPMVLESVSVAGPGARAFS